CDAKTAHLTGLLHLRGETAPHVGVLRPVGVQHLHRDLSPVRRLAEEHLTEPTTAQRAHQSEITHDTTDFGHCSAFPVVSVGFSCPRSSVPAPDPLEYGPPPISTAVSDCSGSAVQ